MYVPNYAESAARSRGTHTHTHMHSPHLDVLGVEVDGARGVRHGSPIVLQLDVRKGAVCKVHGTGRVEINGLGVAIHGRCIVLAYRVGWGWGGKGPGRAWSFGRS